LIANEHDQQAGELEDAIDRLDGIDFTQDAWDTQLDVLISLVQRHVDEEEHEYFPEAQKVLGRDVAKGLEERFHQAKRACLASLE
jgi:hemerythrin-like domain-containing protein